MHVTAEREILALAREIRAVVRNRTKDVSQNTRIFLVHAVPFQQQGLDLLGLIIRQVAFAIWRGWLRDRLTTLGRLANSLFVAFHSPLISGVAALLYPPAFITGKQRLRFDFDLALFVVAQPLHIGFGDVEVLELLKCGFYRSVQKVRDLYLQTIGITLLVSRLVEIVLRQAIPKSPATYRNDIAGFLRQRPAERQIIEQARQVCPRECLKAGHIGRGIFGRHQVIPGSAVESNIGS